jgi:hypothetical protein
MKMVCGTDLTPDGYYCSRPCRHQGPCCAWPINHQFTSFRTQSRRASLAESIANIVIGIWIQMAGAGLAFHFLHVKISGGKFVWFTLIMTVLSVVRSYCLRRLWNSEWWKRKR